MMSAPCEISSLTGSRRYSRSGQNPVIPDVLAMVMPEPAAIEVEWRDAFAGSK